MDSEDFIDDDSWLYDARLLNVYLTSNHPSLQAVTDKLFKDVYFSGQPSKIRKHLKILILNLVHAKKQRQQGTIRYSRRNDHWKEFNAVWPNPWGISAKLDDIIDTMEKEGLLFVRIGYVNNNEKRQTRIKPTAKFTKKYIKPFDLLNLPLEFHDSFPLVQVHLKIPAPYNPQKALHRRYEARGRTNIPNQLKAMKDQLKRYNSFIAKQKLTLEKCQETQESLSNVDFNLKNRTYRVFTNDQITEGGRFYGGWWQEIKADLRAYIRINGESTVEYDYKSQHAAMLYGYCLKQSIAEIHGVGFDPYAIPSRPRELGKAIFTRALNVRSRNNLRASLIKTFSRDLEEGSSKDQNTAKLCLPHVLNDFNAVMDAFETLHQPVLKPKRFLYPQKQDQKWWKTFQFFDSQVCMYVLDTLTKEKIPCLSIHDSFIVQQKHEKRLREVMKEAYSKALYVPDLIKCVPEILKKQ